MSSERYQSSIPWIPGSNLTATNEQQSRTRSYNVNKKLAKNEKLKQEYEKIIDDQLTNGVIERSPEKPSGERVYYMPHTPVVRKDVATTKVRMVFDASSKPHPLSSSILFGRIVAKQLLRNRNAHAVTLNVRQHVFLSKRASHSSGFRSFVNSACLVFTNVARFVLF